MFLSWLLGFCIIASSLALLIHLYINVCLFCAIISCYSWEFPRSILLLLVFVAFFKNFVILLIHLSNFNACLINVCLFWAIISCNFWEFPRSIFVGPCCIL